MSNELFQARVDDEFADEIHRYRESQHMSKSETVRAGLRELVYDEDQEDGSEGEAWRTGRVEQSGLIIAGLALAGALYVVASGTLPAFIAAAFGALVGGVVGAST